MSTDPVQVSKVVVSGGAAASRAAISADAERA